MELLHATTIHQHLTPEAQQYFSPIEIFPLIDSTNTYLLTHNPSVGAVCLAEQQTAGRGRQGRAWISPYAENIYLSVLCEIDNNPSSTGLSLLAGLSIITALSLFGIQGLKIKWPNDILHEERKLAGVLLEVAHQNAKKMQIVIGIGLNINMQTPSNIDQPWVDLARLTPQTLSRNHIVAQLLNTLYEQIQRFNAQQLTHLIPQWPFLDALYDSPVKVHQGDQILTGIAKGITPQGLLQLQQGDILLTIRSGEVKKVRKIDKS